MVVFFTTREPVLFTIARRRLFIIFLQLRHSVPRNMLISRTSHCSSSLQLCSEIFVECVCWYSWRCSSTRVSVFAGARSMRSYSSCRDCGGYVFLQDRKRRRWRGSPNKESCRVITRNDRDEGYGLECPGDQRIALKLEIEFSSSFAPGQIYFANIPHPSPRW